MIQGAKKMVVAEAEEPREDHRHMCVDEVCGRLSAAADDIRRLWQKYNLTCRPINDAGLFYFMIEVEAIRGNLKDAVGTMFADKTDEAFEKAGL